jgi:hypothetical protein
MGAYLPDLPHAHNSRSVELASSRTRKLSEKSGDKGSKKAETTSDASVGKSAGQKSQPSGGNVREKSQATHMVLWRDHQNPKDDTWEITRSKVQRHFSQ